MKRNLALLAKYRQKMAWIVAVIITMLIMFGIFFAGLTMGQYTQNSETESIEIKIDRAVNLEQIREMLSAEKIQEYDKMFSALIDDVRIYDNEKIVFDTLWWNIWKDDIRPNIPVIIQEFRYLMKKIEINNNHYTVLARVPTEGNDKWLIWLVVYTVISAVFVFIFVLFLSYHLVNYFFHPMRLIVENLEDFTGNINHEFKTSLAEVISSLELAEITKNYEKSVRQAIESSRRINMILDSLGHTIYFVNSDYRRENVDLIKLFEKSLWEFQWQMKNKKIQFIRKYSQNKALFQTIDHEPLVLVFRNIFKNAIRYSHEWGKIELTIHKNFFSVKDYGVGIAEENLDKVFGRYFREDYSREGSGIGLALAKKIVERYDWNLEIESEKWKFTQVTVFWWKVWEKFWEKFWEK